MRKIQAKTQSVLLHIQEVGEQGKDDSDLRDAGQRLTKQRKGLNKVTN